MRLVRLVRLVAAAGFAIVFGACNVDVSVVVDADAGGSGEVRVIAVFDREAAEAIGDFDERLRTDDLRSAGWSVASPEHRDDGSVAIVVRRPLDRGLDGIGAPFRGLSVTQRRGFLRTETSFSGNVDLARGIESFGDDALTAAFEGQPLGVSVADLERRLGAPVDQVFGLQVVADLPGDIVESNAPASAAGARSAGGNAVWSPALGEQLHMAVTAKQWNVRNIGLLSISVVTALAAAGSLVRSRYRQ